MEKKNINISLVRTCTILLLIVFTIGRKYGQGGNAENLINSLQQQPCACCLNFNDVSEVAKVIDRAKNQLQQDKEELKEQKGYLEGQLEVTKRQAEVQEVQLREEIQKSEDENKELKNEINNLKSGNNENAGATQVAKELDLKWKDYVEKLSVLNVCKEKLENNIRDINEEKTNLEKELDENKKKLHEKGLELENTRIKFKEFTEEKTKIENDLRTKNEEIELYKKTNTELNEKITQLGNDLNNLEVDYSGKYEKIVLNNTKSVEQNTEAINNINASLEKWNDDNKKIIADIEKKTKEIEKLNNQIKDNNSKIEKLNKEKDELNDKYDKLDIDHKELIQKYEEIEQEKKELANTLEVCEKQMVYLTTQTNTLNDILKNTKTNVNMEEYANLYNSINAQKRANISIFLNKDVKTFPQKQYTFYIPFKFKDYGQCAIKKTISDVFTKNPGIYTTNLSLYDILRSFFEIKAFEKFKELKIIKVTNLKKF